jgi:Carbohydrate family 9 binding domain-like
MVRSACSRQLGAVIAAATMLGSGAFAAQPVSQSTQDSTNYTVKAVRIDSSEAPKIDGDLSDAVWAKAAVLDDFPQMEPNAGQPATERTVLRILYDENNIYFGVYLYDDEPDKIAVRSMTRDGPVFAEDEFRIVLDPNMTRRNGYEFEVGPAGGREDALVQNNTADLTRWNTIWVARWRVVAGGWVAEIAIAFRDFSYDPARPDWGFDFVRVIRRKAERDR